MSQVMIDPSGGACPAGSQVGLAGLGSSGSYTESLKVPIFNVAPDRGYPALFAADVMGTVISLYTFPPSQD